MKERRKREIENITNYNSLNGTTDSKSRRTRESDGYARKDEGEIERALPGRITALDEGKRDGEEKTHGKEKVGLIAVTDDDDGLQPIWQKWRRRPQSRQRGELSGRTYKSTGVPLTLQHFVSYAG